MKRLFEITLRVAALLAKKIGTLRAAGAIAECREKKPEKYVAICASLLPKEVDLALAVDIESRVELGDFIADYRLIREALERIGAKPLMLEATDND